MTDHDPALLETKPDAAQREKQRLLKVAQAGKLFEKLPPHAVESEMSLLGSLLLDPQVVGEVVQTIRSGNDFFKPAHRILFDTIVSLYDQNSGLDLTLLYEVLRDRGLLEKVGGDAYLTELAETVPAASHALHYARHVRDKAIIRHLISVAGEIVYDAYNDPGEAQSILDEAERRLFQIADRYTHLEYESLGRLLQETLEWLTNTEGQVHGVLTQFADFDNLTGGLQKGELVIIAARPSMGKTSLALNMAEGIALGEHGRSGLPVGFFSLEMSRQQLVERLIAARAGVDVQKLRRNMITKQELPRIRQTCELLEDARLFIDDMAGLTLLQLRAKARRMVHRDGVQVVFVDYLQLLTIGSRAESRQVEVSEISRGLKSLARELSVPIVCLAQLNRSAEQRADHRPWLSDLRESGSIEQEADVVGLLHREEYFHKEEPHWRDENPDKVGIAELIIAKQRNGPTDIVRLQWDARTTRFHNLARSHSGREGVPF